MKKRLENQKKNHNELNIYLSKFGAKIKDGQNYTTAYKKLTIVNKFNIERTIEPYVIRRLKDNNEYWTFDGLMNQSKKIAYEKLKLIVESKGGRIKDGQKYVSNIIKMIFIDENGFEFSTIPKIIFNNSWGRSSDNEYQLAQIKEIVKNNGWTIKSGESYINANKKMTFFNEHGVEFKMTPSRVKQGIKYNQDASFQFEKIKKIVLSKGGKIKEGEIYKNAKTKMTFIDEHGFEFKNTPAKIVQGFWNNGKGISEEICRQCIEFIFKKEFPSDWSVIKVNNDNKNNLQLDGYNKELNVAFEYQGEQHYCYKYMFAKNSIEKYKAFKKQKERDFFKQQFCKNKGISLIQIKYFDKKFKNDIEYLNYVIQEISIHYKKFNNYLKNLETKDFILKDISPRKERLNLIQKIVKSRGGKLNSNFVYKANNKMIDLIDENGQEFSITPISLLKGSWSNFSISQSSTYQIEIIEKHIKKFGAIVKDKNSYQGKYSTITIINQHGIEKQYPAHYLKKIDKSSPFWNDKGDEKEKRTQALNIILNKNGANIKLGELYEHSEKPITIVNKFGLEMKLSPKNIMRMKDSHYFLHNESSE